MSGRQTTLRRQDAAPAPRAEVVRLLADKANPATALQDARVTNRAFNRFLGIRARDKRLLERYRPVLLRGAKAFAKVFYEYLFGHAATAQVLHAYRQAGGKIDALVRKQTAHLHELLAARTDEANAATMARIGEVHYRYRIAPVWIMGAYLRYLDHLLAIVHRDPRIPARDRAPLENAVTKLLFRDMGLQLEGYWLAANLALSTERDKVSELQSQITSLLANIPQLIWSVDVARNKPLYVSPVTRAICDMDVEMPIPCLGWTVPEERGRVERAWQIALAGSPAEIETRVQEPGGPVRWFRRMFYPFKNARGKVVRIDGIMEDVTEARALSARLETLATTDSLTGLPNRTLFRDRLGQAISAAQRAPGTHVVVMLMDLDHFKEINDTLGHQAGDHVLAELAKRLYVVLREGDTVTRLGGDEFAVLLPASEDPVHTAEKVARKILAAMTQPVHYNGNELFLSGSIGIVSCPQHGEDVDTLLSRADVAMYACKNRDARFLFYDSAFDPNTPQRLQLASDLRRALARGELSLHFQPIVSLSNGQVIGAEALIRWKHPTRGMVAPEEFVPLAERSGLIKPITDWVVEAALSQAKRWHQRGWPLRVAVNVSGRVFQDPTFTERVGELLARTGVHASCLEVEVTENVLMSDIEHVSRTLKALSTLGVTTAIDDFGTGYSSLAHLKRLPLNTLKIDQSFVRDMTSDEAAGPIVRAIIDLAHNLGREVIAEGVENHDTQQLLEMLGCDAAQGFHLAEPLPAAAFETWLTSDPTRGVRPGACR